MISYNGLQQQLKKKGISKTDLTIVLGISSRIKAKIGKGDKLSRVVIEKLCNYFNCSPDEIFKEVSDNHI